MWQEEEEEESYAQAALSLSGFYNIHPVPVEWSGVPTHCPAHYSCTTCKGTIAWQVKLADSGIR